MANEYYERLSEMNPGDLADGLAIEAEFNAIAQGFSKLPTPHTGGQGFDGPVRVGDAVNPDEAVSKGQLDATLGTAKPLAVTGYGDFNDATWATLPSGTYLLFGTGSQFANAPFALAAAKTYTFAVRHAIGTDLYCDSVVMSSLDDSAHVDLGREAWRSGPTLAQSAWRAAALKVGVVGVLEALTPAADKLPFLTGANSAALTPLTPYARTLLDDADYRESRKTLLLPTDGPFGHRNVIINGEMAVAQRGTSGTLPLGAYSYTLDRWFIDCYGAALTWSQQGGPKRNQQESLIISGAAGNTSLAIRHRIEALNTAGLVGSKVSLSYWLYADKAGLSVTPTLFCANSLDNFSSPILAQAAAQVQVPVGWNRFEFTFNALPGEAANGVELAFTVSGVGAGYSIGLSTVQLELGEVATPFEYRSYGTELALCQRYYQTITVGTRVVGGWWYLETTLPVVMRTNPTIGTSSVIVDELTTKTLSPSATNSRFIMNASNITPTASYPAIALSYPLSAEL